MKLPIPVIPYNRQKKPWRRFNWFYTVSQRRCRSLRRFLYSLIVIECFTAFHGEPELVQSLFQKFYMVTHQEERMIQNGAPPFPGNAPYPVGIDERGFSIEWKDGKLKIWERKQTVYPVEE